MEHDGIFDAADALPEEALDPMHHSYEPRNGWLRSAPSSEQLIAMQAWFLARHGSPIQLPTKDIHRSVHLVASEPLYGRFLGIVDDRLIFDLIGWLEVHGTVWTRLRIPRQRR
jgi:hypothetical protein